MISTIKTLKALLFLLSGYIIVTFVGNMFLITEDLYYYSFREQLTTVKIEQLFLFKSRWEWLSYVIIVLSIIVKISIITLGLYTGVILSSLKVKFISLIRIVSQAEFLFLFAASIKLYLIYFFMDNYSLTSIGYFQPLSIINFFESSETEPWLVYPLRLVNLFELGYWLLLSYLLMDILEKTFWKSLEFVLSTYVVGLIIWVVFVVFLTLNFS